MTREVARRTCALAAHTALALFACSSPEQPPPPASHGALAPGMVAQVGSAPIGIDTVASVASAQQIPPRDALSREVSDALFASGALADGLDESFTVRAATRGLLARAELEALKKGASESSPTDAEIAEATARHFVELDRPETFRVIHAVVRFPDKADAAAKMRARTVAERVAERVARAHDESEFRSLAESVDERDGLDIVVETLKPVAADGRVVDVNRPNDREMLLLPFARAASHLAQPGQKSALVSTDYGFHTMMLLERLPPRVVPLDERRDRLRDEIVRDRARRLKKELLQRLRSNVTAQIERSADAVLATVPVGGHEEP